MQMAANHERAGREVVMTAANQTAVAAGMAECRPAVVSAGGPPYKGIIWSQKSRETSGFFCGQRYYWTKVLRIGLLAGFSALIFRNQNPAYTIKKRKGKLSSIGGIPNSESEWIHLLAELHCCTVRSTWQLLHRRVSVVWTAQRSLCLYSLLRDVIAAAANPAGWIRLPVRGIAS